MEKIFILLSVLIFCFIAFLFFSFNMYNKIKNYIYQLHHYSTVIENLKDKEEIVKIRLTALYEREKAVVAALKQAKEKIIAIELENQNKFYSSWEQEQKKYEDKMDLLREEANKTKEKYNGAKEEYKQNYLKLMEELTVDFQSKLLYNNNIIKNKQNECDLIQSKLNSLKKSYDSRIEIMRHESEEECKRSFYQIQLAESFIEDIKKINSFKTNLKDETVLNKLIWKTYIEKPTSDLLTKLFGVRTICGIYKITNITNEKSYIGQSVNVKDRIKTHIKCGVGAETATANKLYTEMKKIGVWNFTFELLEECPREQLNEKESFWIQFYDSFNYGLNATQGNRS